MTTTENGSASHRVINPRVLYFGTPVVLIGTENPDGSTNVAPMSSAWWVGSTCVLGLDETSATTLNLMRTGELTLSLPDAGMAGPVNRLALTTGTSIIPQHKVTKGYTHVADKFGRAELTPAPSDLVKPPWVFECSIALECTVTTVTPIGGEDSGVVSVEVEVLRTHARPEILVPGSETHIDPERWDPLIMKFTHLYGHATRLEPSRLAMGWQIPEPSPQQPESPATQWTRVFDDVFTTPVADMAAVTRWYLRAGAELPHHDHAEREHILIRTGALRLNAGGQVLRSGDVLTTDVGASHGGSAEADTELWVIAVRSDRVGVSDPDGPT